MNPGCEPAFEAQLDRLLAGWVDSAPSLTVSGLCHDSRRVRPGDLFFALAGSRSHGMRFAAQAEACGACAVVYDPVRGGEEWAGSQTGIPCVAVPQLDQKMGLVADRFFGEPSRHQRVIGVTGTNGKTSCSHFIADALNDGDSAAVIGTLGWGAPGALSPTSHTTPDAIEVHALLARLQARGVKAVAMEASSHGLEQGRLNGLRFEGGLFTNLSRDHLDYHGDMEAYLEAKLVLMQWPGIRFIAFNLDDGRADSVRLRIPPDAAKIGFTRREGKFSIQGVEIVRATNIRHQREGVAFDVSFAGESAEVAAAVYGDYNVENLLGSLAVLLGMGFGLEEAAQRLRRVGPVPGRMERFGAGPAVVVDYAHTPDALAKTLTSLRRHCRGSLWALFGCGGERDRGKRPQMGAIAEKLADRVVLTDDNPRGEDGGTIIAEILSGCERKDIIVMRDRRLAIACALEQVGPEDVVLVAGKGHEDSQEIDGVKYPFSDREVVRESLQRREAR
ncbi:MAG: UDP-N-acetylmuramoyl-L-alanyl-D-glutamate--2,6-diaminopimelate ligase [Methylococcaceae bacterium]|nr:UDP-N-acetylmuramoyl-L-alanyl-D-glutamate--2,6-diaminopimelate ligase [Methylococcaceae bacterium]